MTDRIEPALSAEEWAEVRARHSLDRWAAVGIPRAIAERNFDLPDSDPRKITREKLDYIREVARVQALGADDNIARHMLAFADALESYLPSEQP